MMVKAISKKEIDFINILFLTRARLINPGNKIRTYLGIEEKVPVRVGIIKEKIP